MPTAQTDSAKLIGAIYDCVIEPELWPDTLTLLADSMRCACSSLTRLERDGPRLIGNIGSHHLDEKWRAMHTSNNYGADAAFFFDKAMAQAGFDFDEPLVISRVLPPEVRAEMRVFKEWATPQGFCDGMSLVVLDTPSKLAMIDMIRHKSVGLFDDAAISLYRTLAPHLRRAVTISNVLDMQRLEAAALAETLEALSHPVVHVGEGGRILRATRAARKTLDDGRVVRGVDGRLAATHPVSQAKLQAAISAARSGATNNAAAEAVLLLPADEADAAAVASILPLALGEVGTRLAPDAIAAVFIADRDSGFDLNARGRAAAFAALYGLTPAETRLLEKLGSGCSITEAAVHCEIEVTTARTHLARLFHKTGTSRQAELVALFGKLSVP